MNRRQADTVAGVVIVSVLVLGLVSAWDAYRRAQATDGMMSHMNDVSTVDPIWYFLGSVLVASVIAGVYVFVRSQLFGTDSDQGPSQSTEPEFELESGPESESESTGSNSRSDGQVPENVFGRPSARQQTLDLLPEDERRILEPVLDSPGLTQIELRDRSEFSKSKVSQTVTDLEKRGLLYREPQGRTYRVYPSDDLQDTG